MDSTVDRDRSPSGDQPREAPSGSAASAVVVAGGDPLAANEVGTLPEDAVVIAADSGIDLALALGLRVDVAVGDFDSVSPASLARVRAEGAAVERHPEAKNATDLELALDAAVRRGVAQVVVLGGHGGRLDHFLANAALLASPSYAAVDLVARMGPAVVTVVRAGRTATFHGALGDVLTLVPVHGPAIGVTTTGLRFPLHDEDLAVGSTRGVSNELAAADATVALRSGTLLAVRPGHHDRTPRKEPT